MPKTPRILFVCKDNSARSQMAEAFARFYGGDAVRAESAGITPEKIHPNTLWAMNEAGIDIQMQSSTSIAGRRLADFDVIVEIGNQPTEPGGALPAGTGRQFWRIPDPTKARGNPLEIQKAFRIVRYQIERSVKELLRQLLR